MKLRFCLFADYANACGDGALNLMGVRDRIFFTHLPIVFPDFCIIFAVEGELDDIGEERIFTMRLIDPDGHSLLEGNGKVTFGNPNDVIYHRHNVHNQQFNLAGRYELQMLFGGTEVYTQALHVIIAPPPNLGPPPSA